MNNRNLKLICLDSLASTLSLYLAFLLRFEFVIPERFFDSFTSWVVVFVLVQAFVFYFSGLYARIWRYTSIFDLFAITRSSIIAFALSIIVIFVITGSSGYPRSVLLLYLILSLVSVLAIRLSARIYFTHYQKREVHIKSQSKRKKLLLIGAGEIGDKIAREILTTGRNKYELIGFVDDNIIKKGALLHGKEVLGSVSDLPHLKISYNELLITFSNASGDEMRRIIGFCKETGKRYKTVPGIHELIDGEVMLDRIRDVSYSDLLGREEVVLDINSLDNMFHGKRVLISGAGGSIGSELVSQCLKFSPAEIICIEVNEEKIHSLEEFSKTVNPKTVIKTILASVNNKKECEKVFLDNRPHIVFHAAAYKHVPIQEIHPWKAVSTNLGGTLNLVELSDKYKVHKFVLVSTDKAVNPVNIMGATKRAAEKLIQSFNPHTSTKLMAVRFGNVLGSSGSAIPTFQKQINDGGPLTITHPEMTRYFMSIQEASQLILQSCAIGKEGEIFLLEMGKPIKIVDMAKDLIRLSGLEPGVDIPIVFSGLRPGEKLYEELQLFNERKLKTQHKKIMILKEKQSLQHWNILKKEILQLLFAANELDSDKILFILKKILPSYKPNTFNQTIQKESVDYGIEGKA